MRHGRSDAIGVLFDRYSRLIFAVAKKILRDPEEAEDLTQEVFIEIYKKAHRYDDRKGTVKIWLLQYAYHRSLNRRRYLALVERRELIGHQLAPLVIAASAA